MALYLVVCLQVAVCVARMSNTRPLFEWEVEFFRMWATARVKRKQNFNVPDSAGQYFSVISQNKRNASVPEGRATKKDEPSQVFLVYPFHWRWLDNHTSKTSEIVNIVNVVIDFSRGPRTSALGPVLSLIKTRCGSVVWVLCTECAVTYSFKKQGLFEGIGLGELMHK